MSSCGKVKARENGNQMFEFKGLWCVTILSLFVLTEPTIEETPLTPDEESEVGEEEEASTEKAQNEEEQEEEKKEKVEL